MAVSVRWNGRSGGSEMANGHVGGQERERESRESDKCREWEKKKKGAHVLTFSGNIGNELMKRFVSLILVENK